MTNPTSSTSPTNLQKALEDIHRTIDIIDDISDFSSEDADNVNHDNVLALVNIIANRRNTLDVCDLLNDIDNNLNLL